MDIDKLAKRLSCLGNLRPPGAIIAILDLGVATVAVVVDGLGQCAIEFHDLILLHKLPSDWQAELPNGPDFGELAVERLGAVRDELEQRIRSRAWHLELPDNVAKLRSDLCDQNAQAIVKKEIFETISFPVILDLKVCSFRSRSQQYVALKQLLSAAELQSIFSACR